MALAMIAMVVNGASTRKVGATVRDGVVPVDHFEGVVVRERYARSYNLHVGSRVSVNPIQS